MYRGSRDERSRRGYSVSTGHPRGIGVKVIEYVTRELAARSNIPPEQRFTVWFFTVEAGEVRIQMSADGLMNLQGLVSRAVGTIPVDASAIASMA
jgi:hypothetical protein